MSNDSRYIEHCKNGAWRFEPRSAKPLMFFSRRLATGWSETQKRFGYVMFC